MKAKKLSLARECLLSNNVKRHNLKEEREELHKQPFQSFSDAMFVLLPCTGLEQ